MNIDIPKIQNDPKSFFLIAGPCVVESEEICMHIAESVKAITDKLDIPYVFKASFKKANRLSAGSFSGIGDDKALGILQKVKEQLKLPICTDVHETIEVDKVAKIVDIIQIPAFLCRQTDLVVKASESGCWVNIKKGQFLAPEDMAKIAGKVDGGKIMLCERGSSFGYRNLIVDFRALLIMKETGCPIVYDATHSLQLPGGGGAVSTGQPQYIIPMAKAAASIGFDGLFVETHPNPEEGLSDAGAMLPLDKLEQMLTEVLAVKKAAHS